MAAGCIPGFAAGGARWSSTPGCFEAGRALTAGAQVAALTDGGADRRVAWGGFRRCRKLGGKSQVVWFLSSRKA